MAWYDWFASFYDASLEALYAEQRQLAAAALDLRGGERILDLPCGTGQSFDAIASRMHGGVLLGGDISPGMLARAEARGGPLDAEIRTTQVDVLTVDASTLTDALGAPTVDRLHVFLGMSAFPEWRDSFGRLWDRLEPGGRCVLVDVHADPLGLQGRMVNLVARADIRRRFWEPLEAVAEEFERRELPSDPRHGGTMFLATGLKPR